MCIIRMLYMVWESDVCSVLVQFRKLLFGYFPFLWGQLLP